VPDLVRRTGETRTAKAFSAEMFPQEPLRAEFPRNPQARIPKNIAVSISFVHIFQRFFLFFIFFFFTFYLFLFKKS
jgi:magnesium-transporting ATPase (P-type)